MTVRAIVADDEPLGRRAVLRVLEEHDWVDVVAVCRSGVEARNAIEGLRPDVVFLDIEMPGLRGTDLLADLTTHPFVIFVTAHPEFAADAFDLHAIDFIRKPIDGDRIEEALRRLRRALASPRAEGLRGRAPDAPMERVFVQRFGKLIPLPTAEITQLEADGDHVVLHTYGGDRRHVRTTFGGLLSQLDGAQFVRVHRSHAVNLDHVVAFVRTSGGRYQVQLTNGAKVFASRRCSKELRARGI